MVEREGSMPSDKDTEQKPRIEASAAAGGDVGGGTTGGGVQNPDEGLASR